MVRPRLKLLAILVLTATWSSAQVLKVPLSFPTVGAALQAAASGSIVLVEGGVYNENITWPAVDGIRLIGVGDPVIDGGRNGRVITVPSGLTRATVIRGLTIRNGLDREGGGVLLQSSITFAENRITGCEGNDAALNRGGAIAVIGGAAPRIQRNVIFGNALRGGGINKGAGIYVDAGSRAEIFGNDIRQNECQGAGDSFGAGLFFEASGIPSPILANNVVVANVCQGANEAAGGGVYVDGGTVTVAGNTIADNRCTSSTRASGGGIGFGPTNGAASPMWNNIVSGNRCAGGPVAIGGGVHCNNANIRFDFNDVWQNVPDNYFGCRPGLNDRSVDPQFVGLGDYRLRATSPLVDAGDNTKPNASLGTDFTGGPRRTDGNLDGIVGNGPRVDIGANEFRGVALTSDVALGQVVDLAVSGPPGFVYALAISSGQAPVLVPPFGTLLLAPPLSFVGAGVTPGNTRFSLPLLPALEGLDVYAQALVYRVTGRGPIGQFTNREHITLTIPFGRPIVEVFATQAQYDSGDAAWASNGRGLGATYGLGGSGADGNLTVAGNMTLDGNTRPAGTFAEWDFQNLTVQQGATLTFTGNRPVRVNVLGNCVVDGTIDASGQNGRNGLPGTASSVGLLPGGAGGPGAGFGGDSNPSPNSPIGALPTELRGGPGFPKAQRCTDLNKSDNRLITVVEPNCGGGTGGNRGIPSGTTLRSGCSGNGGGHGGSGDQTDFLCGRISSFGREFGVRWVVPSGPGQVQSPTCGTGGGAGGNMVVVLGQPTPANDIVAGSGGGGGGGLEIASVGSLTVRGSILSNGGNGGAGVTTLINNLTLAAGFGGGGSGGSIWLSAVSLSVDSSATISAQGGIGNPTPPQPLRSGNGGPGYVILRDLSGNPTIGQGATITPAQVPGRGQLGFSGLSSAVSKWYSATIARPSWAFNASNPQNGVVLPGSDLVFSVPPTALQQVKITFQGAPDLNGKPNPNPATWVPANGFTTNIAQLVNLRHIRFKIEFSLGSVSGPPLPSRPVITRLTLRY